jgi:hypothetical protein
MGRWGHRLPPQRSLWRVLRAVPAQVTLVVEQVVELDAAVAAGFGERDLAGFEQFDQGGSGDAQQVGCFLGGEQCA